MSGSRAALFVDSDDSDQLELNQDQPKQKKKNQLPNKTEGGGKQRKPRHQFFSNPILNQQVSDQVKQQQTSSNKQAVGHPSSSPARSASRNKLGGFGFYGGGEAPKVKVRLPTGQASSSNKDKKKVGEKGKGKGKGKISEEDGSSSSEVEVVDGRIRKKNKNRRAPAPVAKKRKTVDPISSDEDELDSEEEVERRRKKRELGKSKPKTKIAVGGGGGTRGDQKTAKSSPASTKKKTKDSTLNLKAKPGVKKGKGKGKGRGTDSTISFSSSDEDDNDSPPARPRISKFKSGRSAQQAYRDTDHSSGEEEKTPSVKALSLRDGPSSPTSAPPHSTPPRPSTSRNVKGQSRSRGGVGVRLDTEDELSPNTSDASADDACLPDDILNYYDASPSVRQAFDKDCVKALARDTELYKKRAKRLELERGEKERRARKEEEAEQAKKKRREAMNENKDDEVAPGTARGSGRGSPLKGFSSGLPRMSPGKSLLIGSGGEMAARFNGGGAGAGAIAGPGPSSTAFASSSTSAAGAKRICPRCTFENEARRELCEICETGTRPQARP